MGASGWTYFVPYKSDIAKALNGLREQVFQSSKYYQREAFWQEMNEDDYSNEDEDIREDSINWLRRMKAMKEPTKIEELILWNEEEGTHSIIDITEISPTPEFGKAAPLDAQQLMNLFNTENPSRSMVEQKVNEIAQLREGWEATYIIVYENGLPDQIFFTGYTGD